MSRRIAALVRDRCLEQAGDRLRIVGAYDGDSFEEVYVREDLRGLFEQQSLDSVLFPLLQTQRLGDLVSGMYDTLEAPRSAVRDYGNAVVFQFPLDGGGGIMVSIDAGGEPLHADVYADCLSGIEEAAGPSR